LPAVLLHVYNTGNVEPLFAGYYSSEYFVLIVVNLLDQSFCNGFLVTYINLYFYK